MRLWRGIAADPVGQPHDDCNHSKPSQSTRESADFLVLGKEAPLGEKNGPVAFLGADEGQRRAACVGHVGADIGEIFEEPEAAKGEAGGFALPEEINCAQQWHKQFGKRAAENHDGIAEPTEEEMSAFVDDQIDVIEDEKSGAVSEVIEEEKYVKTKPGNPGATRNRFPFSEFVFEEGHCPSVASGPRQKKDPATMCVDTSRPEERALISRGATSLPGHMPRVRRPLLVGGC